MEVQRRWLWNGKWIWLIMKGEKGEFPETSGSFLKTDKVRYQRTVLNCSLVTMQTPMNCHKPQSVALILDAVCMCKKLAPAWGTPWEPRACLATLSIPSAWCGIVLWQSKCLTTFLEGGINKWRWRALRAGWAQSQGTSSALRFCPLFPWDAGKSYCFSCQASLPSSN